MTEPVEDEAELRSVFDAEFKVLGPAGSVDDARDRLNGQRTDAAFLDVILGNER